MRLARIFYSSLAAGAVVFATACNDDHVAVGPQPAVFYPAEARTKMEPLAAVLDQPVFKSFDVSLRFYDTFFRAIPIPVNVQGKTYVYDEAQRLYVPDPNSTGAPATGVRFVLYSWEPGMASPATPLTRIGYVDIAPAGTDAESPVKVKLVRDAGNLEVANFLVEHKVEVDLNTFVVEGSATDGTTVMVIALDGTQGGATGQHQLVFNSTLSSAALGISSYEELTFDQARAWQGGKLELSYDGHNFLNQSVPGGTDLKFDGNLYAHVLAADSSAPETLYLRPDGTLLSAQEIADVSALLLRMVSVNFYWINIAWP